MNKIWLLFKFDLKINSKQIIAWTVGLSGFMALYMGLFDYIKEIGFAKLDAMPQEILQLFNISSLNVMNDYTLFYGTMIGIILVICSVFASIFGANLVRNEEKTKSIEYKASLNLSRSVIYLSKLLTLLTAILIIVFFVNLTAIIVGEIGNYSTFDLLDTLLIAKYTSVIPFFFGFVSIGLAGMSYQISSPNISSGLVAICYLGGYLTTFIEKDIADILKYISPFQVFTANEALTSDISVLLLGLVYFLVSLTIALIGCVIYSKRNLVI